MRSRQPSQASAGSLGLFPDEVAKVQAGAKTVHRSDERLASAGETVTLGEHRLQIVDVFQQPLLAMTEADAREEGYRSLSEFRFAYRVNHPGIETLGHVTLWVHRLRPV